MPAEGMVHALEIIHDLLREDGWLIDIHPTGIPPVLEIVEADQRTFTGNMQDKKNFIEYFQAAQALETSVESGLFSLEEHWEFDFVITANSLAELQEYMTANWKDGFLDEQTIQRTAEEESHRPSGKLELTERIHISRLKPIRR